MTTASFATLPPSPETWDKTAGTHLIGHIKTSYSNLVDIFGPSHAGEGHQTDANWFIEFADGTIATIYNYKDGKNYLGDEGLPVAEITNWHVGGKDDAAMDWVRTMLYRRLVATWPRMEAEGPRP